MGEVPRFFPEKGGEGEKEKGGVEELEVYHSQKFLKAFVSPLMVH